MSFQKSLSSPPAKQESRGHPGCTKASKYYLSLPIKRKRELYKCANYKTVDDLPIWASLEKEFHTQVESLRKQSKKYKLDKKGKDVFVYKANEKINEKICLHQGDITALEIDAIVNAANQSCLGGGGVDGAIHRAAGRTLREECEHLNGCKTGMSKITGGHELPARYVIHTVGPVDGSKTKLQSCYKTCLELVLDYKIRTVAFCCIATGVYGYPNRDAAHVALNVARDFLEQHHDKVDRIIFCTFLPIDFDSYLELMATNYFPVTGKSEHVKEGTESIDESMRDDGQQRSTESKDSQQTDVDKEKMETESIDESMTDDEQQCSTENEDSQRPDFDKEKMDTDESLNEKQTKLEDLIKGKSMDVSENKELDKNDVKKDEEDLKEEEGQNEPIESEDITPPTEKESDEKCNEDDEKVMESDGKSNVDSEGDETGCKNLDDKENFEMSKEKETKITHDNFAGEDNKEFQDAKNDDEKKKNQ